MFDSPFAFCRVCRQYVLLDQTQEQCAREHACDDSACGLRRYFTGIDFGANRVVAVPRGGNKRPAQIRRRS